MLLKEIKDVNKWKDTHIHGLRNNIVKKAILVKMLYAFDKIPNKVSTRLCRNWQYDPKIHAKFQDTQKSQYTLEKKNMENSHLQILKLTTKLQKSKCLFKYHNLLFQNKNLSVVLPYIPSMLWYLNWSDTNGHYILKSHFTFYLHKHLPLSAEYKYKFRKK